jgi:hypothetical protein
MRIAYTVVTGKNLHEMHKDWDMLVCACVRLRSGYCAVVFASEPRERVTQMCLSAMCCMCCGCKPETVTEQAGM